MPNALISKVDFKIFSLKAFSLPVCTHETGISYMPSIRTGPATTVSVHERHDLPTPGAYELCAPFYCSKHKVGITEGYRSIMWETMFLA